VQVILIYFQLFRCNSRLKCVSQPKIAKNSLKLPILGDQGHYKVINVDISKKLVASACYVISCMPLPICIHSHFHVRLANSCRITFLEGVPPFRPLFVRILLTQWYEILSRNTKDTELSCSENSKSLSQLVLDRYQVVTDRRTDRQNYHSCIYALYLAIASSRA